MIFLQKTLDIFRAVGYNNTRRQGRGPRRKEYADVAELADALDSGSSSLKRVWVQIPSSALFCRTKGYSCNCDDTIQLRTYQNKGVVGAGKRSKVNILEMFLALLEMMRLICRKMTEKVSFFV